MGQSSEEARRLLSVNAKYYPDTVWLSDLDDTLIDTARMHDKAVLSVITRLKSFIHETEAVRIGKRFNDLFQLLIKAHQSNGPDAAASHSQSMMEAEDLTARIENDQQDIIERWGAPKRFSREALLKVAGDDYGVRFTAAQIQYTIDGYWEDLKYHPIYFSGAVTLTKRVMEAGYPLFIMTSSDGRLTLSDTGQFEYDPDLSRTFKADRVESLREQGLAYRDVIIGDPVDKPTPDFFEILYRRVEQGLSGRFNPRHCVVLGDSYRSDLKIPMSQWDAGLGILYRPGQAEAATEQQRVVSVGSWDSVGSVLTSLRL